MEETVKQQWVKLLTVRAAIANKLPGERNKEIRDALFEAHNAIGYALLYLERVEFRLGGNSAEMIDEQVEAQPEA